MTDKEKIEQLEKQVAQLREKLYAGKEELNYNSWSKKACKSLVEYIETMAAAYCKFTDLNPNECMLCSSVTDEGRQLVYWFEKKDPNLQAIHKADYING